jgi:hypothetical protein
LLARRPGRSAGSACSRPFFPRILEHLVGLDHLIRQRRAVGGGQGAGLHRVPQLQQVGPAAAQLARQPRRGDALRHAAEDQHDPGGAAMGLVQRRGGEGVEDPPAALAAVVDGGVAVAAVDGQPGAGATAGAGQAVGVEQPQEPPVAGRFVHQAIEGEVHGGAPKGGR